VTPLKWNLLDDWLTFGDDRGRWGRTWLVLTYQRLLFIQLNWPMKKRFTSTVVHRPGSAYLSGNRSITRPGYARLDSSR
jgi:hypothetical protein